jgi:RHS repeat-associated protein
MKRSQPIQICHYRYDALDRLIGHTLTDEPQLQRFYSKNRLATEIQSAVKHSIVQHGDVLLAQQRFENDAFNTSLLATDQQRSVTQTLNADHSIQPIAYSPYGHRLPANGMCSLLGFNGERPDPVTGHYLLGNGYRAFNPVLMRFNSPDSLSPFGNGGLNSYGYCLGDPVNRYDETGHMPKTLKAVTGSNRIKASPSYITMRNSDPNFKLSNAFYLEDYKYARNLDPKIETPKQRLEDMAALRVPREQIKSLPPTLQQPVREAQARRLLPLYEFLSSTPHYRPETKLSVARLDELDAMIIGKIPTPKGISIDDVKFYQQEILSIRNPDHKTT